jgi:hypothetical protein
MSEAPDHRIHVWPWLRRFGGRLLKDWLAITVGRHIFAWRPMSRAELAHELEHVRQWRAYGPWRFPIAYAAASLRARLDGRRWYHDNVFEEAARAAARGSKKR